MAVPQDDPDSHLRSELSRQAAIERFRDRPESETGWDRLRELYTIKHIQYADFEGSPELEVIGSVLKLGMGLGFLTGFFNHWKVAKETFIRQNKAHKFLSQEEFMKEAYKYQLKFSARHGLRFGVRLGLLSGLYSLSTMTFAMYNNRLGVKEYAIAGLVTGAAWQSRVGLPGIVMGGMTGGLLGGIAGFASVKLLEYQKVDLAVLRYTLHLSQLQEWERRTEMQTKVLMDELIKEAREELERT